MSWLFLLLGLAIAVIGSAGAAALVTTAREALAEALSRRLRGIEESLGWLGDVEQKVIAAGAATALGVVIVGATIPALLAGFTLVELGGVLLVLIVPATLLGGYLLPRWLTASRAEAVVTALSPILGVWRAILGIVLPTGTHHAVTDVQRLASEGSASGLGTGEQLMMVSGVMSFADRPVRAVMTPRTDVVAVEHDAPYAEVLRVFTECGYTRLPVMRGSLDEIVGIIHAFDLFKLQPGDPLPIRPIAHAPMSRAAGDLLVDMQRERRHFAVVLDEFGGTAGIVTLEDLLEAMVGEISDEDDAEASPVTAVDADLMLLDGTATADDVAEHFDLVLPRTEATSFAGLVVELAGRIPRVGERFRLLGLEVDVLEATPARIERLIVRRPTATITLDRSGTA
jgi:putative hemolysin